jgi:hypothetical protein
MYGRLVKAFREKDMTRILKLSAEIGHYLSDAHVPLHTSSNHNGQQTGQHGIHGFWESRVPELLAEKEWDFFIGQAFYIRNKLQFTWQCILESAGAVDSVLGKERELSRQMPPDRKYAFELRNGKLVRQYSSEFTRAYDRLLNNMVERRMRQSILVTASFWYSAWIDAGQPRLEVQAGLELSGEEWQSIEELNQAWRKGEMIGRKEEE